MDWATVIASGAFGVIGSITGAMFAYRWHEQSDDRQRRRVSALREYAQHVEWFHAFQNVHEFTIATLNNREYDKEKGITSALVTAWMNDRNSRVAGFGRLDIASTTEMRSAQKDIDTLSRSVAAGTYASAAEVVGAINTATEAARVVLDNARERRDEQLRQIREEMSFLLALRD